uniref:Uncharacterized protein n=1 Tax=viral metagenome TaxID=1070528 RepID=A0A6M3XHI9_9ZZZZ
MEIDVNDAKRDNELTRRAILEDQAFDRKSEQFHRGQKELRPGRNFLWNTFRYKTRKDLDNFRKNFDLTFPGAPGVGF